MICSVADAQARALAECAPGPIERVAMTAAAGRVLRAALDAAADVPARATSMMDGFALRAGPARSLRLVEESAAGRPSDRPLADGEAAPISTGAILPAGADVVVPIEEARRGGERVEVPSTSSGRFVRAPGSELRSGERLIDPGATLDAAAIALVCGEGLAAVEVARRPRVAIISTGAELREVGAARAEGTLWDQNGPALAALVEAAGGEVVSRRIVGDDRAATQAAIAAARCDLLLISGGVSVGEHDHVRPAIEALGGDILLWRVAMKPGKPLVLARAGAQRIVGLPGNPVSVQVGFWLFARPMIRRLLGAEPADDLLRAEVTLDASLAIDTDRATYLRARVDSGTMRAAIAGRQGSAAIVSMYRANALVIVEPGAHRLDAGARLPALLLPVG